jgi:uncharacterized protein
MLVLPVTVSAVTAGILIIIQMVLMVRVGSARQRNRQSLGDGGKDELLRAVRRHGNLAENAAIFIAGFTLLEIGGGNHTTLVVMCSAFVLARISHLIGLSMKNTVNPFRLVGVVVTAFVGIALGVQLIALAAPHLTV